MFDIGACLLLAQGQAPDGGPASFLQSPLVPFLFIGLLFYFMIMRPERRRRSELAGMLENLKKNDRVITAGGIYGTVVNVQKGDSDVVIKVDENSNTRLRVTRSSISRVLTDTDSEKSASA
jgi:preprotein translocase subunit YajC